MKDHFKTIGLLFLVLCVFVACRTPGQSRVAEPASLEEAFAAADESFRAATEEVAVSIRRGDYVTAATRLESLLGESTLSDVQRGLVEATMVEVRAALTDLNNFAALEARRAFAGQPVGEGL